MKLEVLQENLAKGLGIVSRVVSNKAQMPILSHVFLKATDSGLELIASNMETTMVVPVGAKIETAGEFTVPARTILELVSGLPAGKVLVETNEGNLKILSGNFRGKIAGTAASEFPNVISEKKSEVYWEIDKQVFLDGVSRTVFVAALDEGRAILTGVLFQLSEKNLVLAATDGFRLSKLTISGVESKGEVESKSVVLPAKALSEVARILNEGGEDRKAERKERLRIYFLGNSQVLFEVGDYKIYSRVISGFFPDFEKIIPANFAFNVIVTASELEKSVKLAAIFARENANIIKFRIQESGFRVQASGGQTGENESEVEAKIEGEVKEEFVIAFNYRYVLDFLGSLGKATEVNLSFSGSVSATVLGAVGEKNYVHIVMPVRVQS